MKFAGSIFYKLRLKISFDVFKNPHSAFVHPLLFYIIEVNGNSSQTQLNKLTILNKLIANIMQN